MSFVWRDHELELWDHPYGATITNERAVEIPIARAWLAESWRGEPGAERGLEVGNVLAHHERDERAGFTFWTPERLVVDRYDESAASLDVFSIEGEFDWILSISTLEHIRHPQDDPPGNEWAPMAAALYLKGLLAPGGRMLITVGLGQRPFFDYQLTSYTGEFAGVMGWTRETLIRLPGAEGAPCWHQTTRLCSLPYRGPGMGALSVLVAEYQAPE